MDCSELERDVHLARGKARAMITGGESAPRDLKHGVYDAPVNQRSPAGTMYGYNVSGKKFFPRLAHAHLDSMMAGTDEVHYSELCAILSRLFEPGTEQWNEYLAVRVAQRKLMEGGGWEYSVVRNVFPPFLPAALKDRAEGMKVKKYELMQFFNDTSVVDKYNLTMKFITSIQTLAINDPESAARTLQEKIQLQSPTVAIRITAGRYSQSRAQCLRILKKAAATARDPQGATQGLFVGPKVFLYEPGKGEGQKAWNVFGPIAYSAAVYDVYKLVLKGGLREVAVLYAFELVKLDINIHDGQDYVQPTFIANVGNADALQFSSLSHSLLFDSALVQANGNASNCLPVMAGGSPIATALRISDTTVVVNAHVVESAECYVEGCKLVGGIPLGQDLWAYSIPGKGNPWRIRAPKVGEKVVLMAAVGGTAAVSPEFRIDKVDGTNIYSRRIAEVVEGASGAAMIALEDGAFLGIHNGLSGMFMLAISMNPNVMTDIREWENDLQRGQEQRQELSVSVVAELDKRGVGSVFMSVIENMHSLFDLTGVHVGSAINLDCKLLTTLPPGEYLVGKDRSKTTFEAYGGLYSASVDSTLITSMNPAVTRVPDTFENVVVVGVDGSSPYVSRVTVIKQVVQGKRTFMSASTEGNVFPLSGGVVLSMQDAAVLGMFVRDSTSTDVGRLSLCASIIRDDIADVKDDVSLLSEKFPTLNVRVWPDGVVDEMCSHSSLSYGKSNLDLARIGDAAARTELHIYLRESGFAGNQQDILTKLQSNTAFAKSAWNTGLATMLRKQTGISFSASSKAYADLFEAFLGAVYLYETHETFREVCFAYGVIPSTGDLSPRLLRRSSSLTGLRVPFGSVIGEDLLMTPVD